MIPDNIYDRLEDLLIRKERDYIESFWRKPQRKIGNYQHNINITNLYENLNSTARIHLDNIVNNIENILDPTIQSYKSLYSDKDYDKFKLFLSFKKAIIKEDNYFRYKHFRLTDRLFEPSVFLYHHGLEYLETLLKFDNEKAIIDVGSFIGDSILVFRDFFPTNTIYAFEPNFKNYSILINTLNLNNISNVIYENIALGNNNDIVYIVPVLRADTKIFKTNLSGSHKVKQTTLDDYVKKYKINVGLIKVDIEGYEQFFIRGAIKTICEQKPILMVSIYHNYDDFFKIKQFIENLDIGYKFDFFKGIDNHVHTDILLLCEVH
jgi:FkbM family methyltransferase